MSDWDGKIRKMSFTGCGFRGSYHLGVIQCFRDKGRSLLNQVEVFSGCSAGGLCAAIALMELSVEKALNFLRQLVREMKLYTFRAFNPKFQLAKYLRDGIDFLLPEQAHKLASDRLHLSVSSIEKTGLSNKIITQYDTRDDLINALVASSYIPGYAGFDFPIYKGKQYFDGGLTNNLPYADHLETLTISPLKGEFDICPIDPHNGWCKLGCYSLVGHKLDFSYFNFQNVWEGLNPASEQAIDELFRQGYQDALFFLYSQWHTPDYSANQTIPLPPTCPILSYNKEGSICVDLDSLATSEDDVFINNQDDEGFFEADTPKQNPPTKPPENSKTFNLSNIQPNNNLNQ